MFVLKMLNSGNFEIKQESEVSTQIGYETSIIEQLNCADNNIETPLRFSLYNMISIFP